jgi:hypothetical protein
MEYNTQRPPLKINDYGRIVVKMIDYAKQLDTKEERNRMANVILDVMAHLNPKIKDRTDYRHILWDHLMMMANYDLDVDCPYPINREETENFHPHPVGYSDKSTIRYPHYGRALEDMVRAIAEMPESEERTLLTSQIAHTMKRQYLQWNRDTVDDQLIAEQLLELSDGRLRLPEGFQFHDSKELLDAMAQVQAKKEASEIKKKKKKKKKKQQQI